MTKMTKKILAVSCTCCLITMLQAQTLHDRDVPAAVRSALEKKYPNATKITWEKEKGNYEANWGGRSGEDNSVQFTATGDFIEIVRAIPVADLPPSILSYVKEHYKGAKITEAGKVTDASGKLSYEVEVHKKDLVFDERGRLLKG